MRPRSCSSGNLLNRAHRSQSGTEGPKRRSVLEGRGAKRPSILVYIYIYIYRVWKRCWRLHGRAAPLTKSADCAQKLMSADVPYLC